MVLVALALRLAVVGFLYPDQMDPSRNHWHFAFENGKVAYSIVQATASAAHSSKTLACRLGRPPSILI